MSEKLIVNFNISVVKHKEHSDSVYIGRGSPLGNPFIMKTEKERDLVCDQYENYFNNKIQEQNEVILNELNRLTEMTIENGYIKLGCFCNPKRCHGDTIKKFLDNVLNTQGN